MTNYDPELDAHYEKLRITVSIGWFIVWIGLGYMALASHIGALSPDVSEANISEMKVEER